MSILPQQTKRWLYPVPDPEPLHCKGCQGDGEYITIHGDEEYSNQCILCNGTGLDDSLEVDIRSGALTVPVEER